MTGGVIRGAVFLTVLLACFHLGKILYPREAPEKFNFLVKGQESFRGATAWRIMPVYPVNILAEQVEGPRDLVRGDALSCKIQITKVGTGMTNGQETDLMQTVLACEKGVKLAVRVVIIQAESGYEGSGPSTK